MWIKLLYALPELSLFAGIIHMLLLCLWEEESEKAYAQTTRLWLLISLFFNIIFYNKSLNPLYFENNAYTLLFVILGYFFAYMLAGVASTWFAAEKKTGCRFNILFLAALILLKILVSAVNATALAACLLLLKFITYRMNTANENHMTHHTAFASCAVNLTITAFLICGTGYLYFLTNGNLNYHFLSAFFIQNENDFGIYIAVCAIIATFLHDLAIPPFHLGTEDRLGKSSLPDSHFHAVIFPLFYWGAFIKLDFMASGAFNTYFMPIYMLFSVLAIAFGAIGANARINLLRIFAFSSMYHFGIVLWLISFFSLAAKFSAFLYLLMYLLALNGVYLTFYNLKSRNEYLFTTAALSGIVENKPYTTIILLISLFSLIGIPPLAGFLGQTNLVFQFTASGHTMYLGIVFIFFLILAKAYLELIKTASFEQKIISYDAENKFVRMFAALNAVLVLSAAFNPFGWIEAFKDMFYAMFI